MDGLRLDYAVPAPDLSDYITLFYDFSAEISTFEDVERADNAQLRFRLSGGRATYQFPDGTVQDAPDIHVIGPTSGAMHVRAEGPVAVFGMGLSAAGWAATIGTDASTMLNRVVAAVDLFGAGRLQLADAALRKAQGIAARTIVGEGLVRDLVRGCDSHGSPGARDFVRQVDAWLVAHPSPAMADLIARTGLSRRQIERKCNALYGAPPKLLARKYRALRAAVAMVANEQTIGEAVDRGFYDQSHMIREIKQFTGLTPGQIRADPGLLSQLTIAQRSALGGSVSPLISET
ncbi:AraC family transcriptional regulator [Sphingomonas sp. RB3P16]|uniref:helix-turn-helix domain-containing protein n=1 Tax=Parasphingomonas frigoris TaxID=3096163 RepID=UPI002FC7A6B5